MSQRPGRFWQAVKSARDGMEMLERHGPEAVGLHKIADSWVVYAVYGDPHPECLVILPAPEAAELRDGGQQITSAVLRKVPLAEIVAEGRQMLDVVTADQ